MKRLLLVECDTLQRIAAVLTGYGAIKAIDHEGTIVYELEGDDAFDLGRLAEEIRQELRSIDVGVDITKAKASA